jgi:hypothetical protein
MILGIAFLLGGFVLLAIAIVLLVCCCCKADGPCHGKVPTNDIHTDGSYGVVPYAPAQFIPDPDPDISDFPKKAKLSDDPSLDPDGEVVLGENPYAAV